MASRFPAIKLVAAENSLDNMSSAIGNENLRGTLHWVDFGFDFSFNSTYCNIMFILNNDAALW